MQHRVGIGNLRGMDPITLEVTITEALRRPLPQLEVAALVDLYALAESDAPSKPLKRDLEQFRSRIDREIADLPDGSVWTAFVGELERLEPQRISAGFRVLLSDLVSQEGRAPSSRATLAPLQGVWAEIPAEPFVVGGGSARVEKHEVMNRSEPLTNRRGIGISESKPKKQRRSRAASGGSSKPKKIVVPPKTIDLEKLAFLSERCMERLAKYRDKGLAEQILVVGVRKQAEESFPDTSSRDVVETLKHMEKQGKVKKSAGRWMVKPRW